MMIDLKETRKMAKQNADKIAALLQSKVVSYNRIHLGEPRWYYRIPFHTEEFWLKVLLSDTAFLFQGEHKRRNAFRVPFALSLKHPWRNIGTTCLLPSISETLGVPIYSALRTNETVIDAFLTKVAFDSLLKKLNLEEIELFFLNSIQIYFISKLNTPEDCATTCGLLRDMILSSYKHSHITTINESEL